MKKLFLITLLAAVSLFATANVRAADATNAAPAAPAEVKLPDATVEQRVADLEQYFQNLGVGAAGDTKWNSKIANVPGPGHNGWMMTCAALGLVLRASYELARREAELALEPAAVPAEPAA